MTFDLHQILASKRAFRNALVARDIVEKLALLDELRARALTLRAAAGLPTILQCSARNPRRIAWTRNPTLHNSSFLPLLCSTPPLLKNLPSRQNNLSPINGKAKVFVTNLQKRLLHASELIHR